jgi:hypothetical protein
MTSRRNVLLSVAAGLAAPALGRAEEPGIVKGRKGGPNMIKGDPPRLDFGGGLLIPMGRATFAAAVWEGQDRWITYGRALSANQMRAMAQAEQSAIAKMKFALLTLAFAPERLERFETCGWKLKSANAADYVKGDIALPGRPVMPTVDRVNGQVGQNVEDAADGESGFHAITGYMVMKADAPLSYVKQKARLLSEAAPS